MRQPRMLAATLFAANISIMPAGAAEPPTLLIPDTKAITSAAATGRRSAPRRPEPRPDLAQRLRRWQTGGPVYLWNQEAVAALLNRQQGNLPASRVLALLHATLYDVALVAETARTPGSSYPGTATAMNTAALAVLSALVPAETERFRALADEGQTLHREAGLETEADCGRRQAHRRRGGEGRARALARRRFASEMGRHRADRPRQMAGDLAARRARQCRNGEPGCSPRLTRSGRRHRRSSARRSSPPRSPR